MRGTTAGLRTLFAGTALFGLLTSLGCTGQIGNPGPNGSDPGPNGSGSGSATGGNATTGGITTGTTTGGSTTTGGGTNMLCTNPAAGPSVGISPLRRLTRSQYNHALRDLLGVAGDHAAKLGLDEKVGLFFSNANTPATELLVEQYMNAADALAAQAIPAKMATIVPCNPAMEDQATCGAKFVDSFGLKAFRRPLSAEERATMVTLFEAGRRDQGFEDGVKRVIQAMIQSPQFLYHIELGPPAAGSPDVVQLDGYILGSRLSFFLWDSTPDSELLRAAGAGELAMPDAMRAQAQRLLGDPRAADTIASFHQQWLGTDQLPDLEKEAKIYPAFTTALRTSMIAETARFSDYVIRAGDGKLDTLFTAPFTFVDATLANFYGVRLQAGADPNKPLDLGNPNRVGILSHAGVLSVHSHADQGSPVRRGKMIRENVLCQPLTPPPPDADTTPPELNPNASTRERFEMHRTQQQCAACHSLIDPIGFGFENFDGIGTFRTTEANKPIDATGQLTSTDIDGPFNGVADLSRKLASSQQVRTCIATQWFTYALGRTQGPLDGCSIDAMATAFAKSNNVRDLLLALVTSDAFRYGHFDKGAP